LIGLSNEYIDIKKYICQEKNIRLYCFQLLTNNSDYNESIVIKTVQSCILKGCHEIA